MNRLLALACCALMAAPASAQSGEEVIAGEVFSAINQVCLPVLRREVDVSNHSAFEDFLKQRGFTDGFSRAQVDLFPPPVDSTLSRAFLVSGEAGADQFVMAIGGVEESCRLFVLGSDDKAAGHHALAARFAQAEAWEQVTPPANASPRIAFVQGGKDEPTALVLIFPESALEGIAFNAIAFAR